MKLAYKYEKTYCDIFKGFVSQYPKGIVKESINRNFVLKEVKHMLKS